MTLAIAISRLAVLITDTDVNLPSTDLTDTKLKDALQVFFMIAGALAVLVIAVGAFQYTVSRGDTNNIKKAKETIIYAAAGLMVTLAGYGIVTFVLTNL